MTKPEIERKLAKLNGWRKDIEGDWHEPTCQLKKTRVCNCNDIRPLDGAYAMELLKLLLTSVFACEFQTSDDNAEFAVQWNHGQRVEAKSPEEAIALAVIAELEKA